jgi:branched-chain amino acid aminotransferase
MKNKAIIPIEKVPKSIIESFNFKDFTFGKTPTDHMLIAEYKNEKWVNARIQAFNKLSLSPLSLCFHYGQTVFEGMKAFRTKDGNLNIFRPFDHHKRFNKSLERMCMAPIPEEIFINGIELLVELDQKWFNTELNNALYIRPFMIASEAKIGVKVSDDYIFMVVLSPIDKYYSKNLRVKVETEFSRAAEGGTGNAKCGGNYGGAFYPTMLANRQGFDQIIWTDAKENLYFEESGTMNIMLIIDKVLLTPELNKSILNGITRNSILTIARDMGIEVRETKFSYLDLKKAFEENKSIEAFGTGTVAVISPIESINIQGVDYKTKVDDDCMMYQLKKRLEDIRRGNSPDLHGWNYTIQNKEMPVQKQLEKNEKIKHEFTN